MQDNSSGYERGCEREDETPTPISTHLHPYTHPQQKIKIIWICRRKNSCDMLTHHAISENDSLLMMIR